MKKNHTFLDEKRETISLSELKSLQLKKLKKAVRFVALKSDLYKHKKNLSQSDANFKSLKDFSNKIPFTTKEDLRGSGIYENLCVPQKDIIEVHFSSGTSGKPAFSFLTKKDIKESNEYLARIWYMQGVKNDSVFGMLASYGLFSAGMINHYAIQRIGALVVPIGNSPFGKTLNILKEFSADSCAAVASYYLYLIKIAEINNISLDTLQLKNIIAGGEPFSEEQRRYIEERLCVNLYDQYGLCEINTGIAGECSEKNGLHILADYVYPEIIDPVTGNILGDDTEGELVLTTFHKEASPLIRYRTGDITKIAHKRCPCGRTMPRISRIKRRVEETLFYKGVKIERMYIANLFENLHEYVNPYIWQMEANTVSGKDELSCKITPTENNKETLNHVMTYLHKNLGLKIKVAAFSEEELVRLGNSKLKNFVDNRNI